MTKQLNFHRRQIPLFVLLGLVASTWAYATVDNRLMCRALEVASLDEVEEFAGGGAAHPGLETATVIVASREFVLFGNTTGKVSLYFKTLRPDGTPQYSGMEFGFELREEEWVMTESWALHEGESTERASRAFGDAV